MMCNPPSVLQQRQRLHRRQNSTPIAFEALQVPHLSPTVQRHNSHRRGQSLDQRSPIRGQYRQTGSTVSITNTGSANIGQQILREAQQQKLARPGQQNHTAVSLQCDAFQDQPLDQNGLYNASTLNALPQEQDSMQVQSPMQQYFPQDMSMPSSAGLEGMDPIVDENHEHYFQPTHSVRQNFGDDMNERRMSQPDLQMHVRQRPITPAQQTNSGHLPLTPATTPFNQNHPQTLFPRTRQSSPVRKHRDETLKAPCPVSMQRGRSLQGIFEGHDYAQDIPSPPGTAPLISCSTFEVAEMPMPHSISSQSLAMSFTYSNDSHNSSQAPPTTLAMGAEQHFQSMNEPGRSPLYGEIRNDLPMIATNIAILPSSQPGTGCSSPTRPELSPRRMSISDLNLEPGVSASIEETNITLDDIAQFIEGPDPMDSKWVCRYEDCGKKFGRKENIKSHVQTHLGDRQFRCDHCHKCFVRGHDLKRHAKIHTGSKPYPCLCGNAFARHDALTRHRQRGNCIGAFEGVVKKVVKKGRPRKQRPGMDDRVDKANKTRKRVEERGGHHYASSSSDSSASSFGSPPTDTFETLSIRAGSPFDDMSLFGVVTQQQQQQQQQQPTLADLTAGFPPDLFTFTPPASPGYSTGNKPSPYHRALTPTDLAEVPDMSGIPLHLLNALSQDAAPHHSPPSLCHSSSSPLPDIIAFDFPSSDQSNTADARLSLKEMTTTMTTGSDFDSFFDYGNMGIDAGQDSLFNL